MDLKFINSEYFFILSAIIKEIDDDEGLDLPKYDFNYLNQISEKIIDKFRTEKNEIFSEEKENIFFYTHTDGNTLGNLFKSKEKVILSDELNDHLNKIKIKGSENYLERNSRIYVCLGWDVTKTNLKCCGRDHYVEEIYGDEVQFDLRNIGITRQNQYQPERFDEWIACEEYKGYFYKENYEGKKKDMGGENGVYNYLGYEENGDDEEEWGEKILLTF